MSEEVETVNGVVELTSADRVETAMLDVQIMTAKRFPRSVVQFKKECEALATIDQETAASMYYRLKRRSGGSDGDQKNIEGPSVRLAEIVANTWTNLHVGARQMEVSKTDRVARSQSVAWDLERNVRVGVEVSRRIIGKNGNQYSEDMIGVTQAAALSIAFRNSVFKVVPFAYVKDIFEKCKEVSIGKGLTMAQRREIALKGYALHKVTEAQLLEYLDRKGWDDVTVDDFIELRGLLTAIKDGDTTAKEAFSTQEKTANLDAVLKPESVKGKDQPVETEKPKTITSEELVEGLDGKPADEKPAKGKKEKPGPKLVEKEKPKDEPAPAGDRSVDDLFGGE